MGDYKRILLKLSGESLMGTKGYGIDHGMLHFFVKEIKSIHERGIEVGIVIGGGNIFRGLKGTEEGFDRVKGDQMGMLATVINSIALQSALEAGGVSANVFTAVRMEPMGTLYQSDKAIAAMQSGTVAIIAGGTGNPFFTTDTASALRAVEIRADVLLKGTRVDGVYDKDPEKNPDAIKFDQLSFDEAFEKGLKIMDLTAFALCKENSLPVVVFNMNEKGNLLALMKGKKLGTRIKNA